MRAFLGYFVGVGLLCAPAWHARAQVDRVDPALRVERDPGAADCPDEVALAAQVQAIRGAGPSAAARYVVRFTREGDVYATQIRSGSDDAGLRRIEDRGSDCSALAQATAVTLALLYDADAARAASAEPPPPALVVAAPAPAPPVPVVDQARAAAPSVQASLALGGGALIGMLRPFAPALLIEVGVALPRLRFAVGALLVPEQQLALDPGRIDASLLSATVRACYAPLRGETLRFDLCTGFALGVIDAEASGFTRNEERSRVFGALPIELALAQFGRAVGWELSAALLVPLRRQQFAVDGAGIAYESPAVAALIALRAVGLLSW